MAIRTGIFKGASVYLSRNLVSPELYDSVHDALRLNGAQVFLCSDPSRTSANDYHAISSPNHEKFEDLKAKGCRLIGPHCILSCARERKTLPKQIYTCCLAMDGVKILASGFEKDEKTKIEQFVTAMGGVLHSRTSPDICFVIVKNVLAAKYKWALNVLKKPIVNMSWLNQCWVEHHLVPHEPYRILPFIGLTICVTKIPLDERKKIEWLILQNGGIYSGDLTKKCTHLVSDSPEGDKYMVAKRWGHISIVTRHWLDQSVLRKACLDEGRYPVHGTSYNDKSESKDHCSQDCSHAASQSIPSNMLQEPESSVSQKISSSFCDGNVAAVNSSEVLNFPLKDETKIEQSVAEDSEDDGNDLYLSDCRILLIGFEGMELRKLVNMIRNSGGTRHVQSSERLTHIIVGSPSEIEKKEVRQLAALGVINVVKSSWLEDCDQVKKEIPVCQHHIASDLFYPKGSSSCEVPSTSFADSKKGKSFLNGEEGSAFAIIKGREESGLNLQESNPSEMIKAQPKENTEPSSINVGNHAGHSSHDSKLTIYGSSPNIFKGHSFCFSEIFPEDRRDDIVEWVGQGGGLMVNDAKKARFIIECHGLHSNPDYISQCTIVSSHWIRSCLEEKCIQDVESHVLYKPLRCHVPLPGFEGFRFCISQYETKERQLLRNLCFTLGSKFTEKLSRKITHLLCKFTCGPKYEAACKWGIQSVSAEWITECIKQDMMVPLVAFRPKEITTQDKEMGICMTSQYPPTQASGLISDETQSQLLTGCQRTTAALDIDTVHSTVLGKRSRFSPKASIDDLPSKHRAIEVLSEPSSAVPDIAAAIEDILEQSNKIQDLQLPNGNDCNKFSDDAICGQGLGITNQWTARAGATVMFNLVSWALILQTSTLHISGENGFSSDLSLMTERYFDSHNPCDNDGKVRAFDAFSETQTESQVVGYEEDLTGRQKIIDRVRSQSLTLTPDAK